MFEEYPGYSFTCTGGQKFGIIMF